MQSVDATSITDLALSLKEAVNRFYGRGQGKFWFKFLRWQTRYSHEKSNN